MAGSKCGMIQGRGRVKVEKVETGERVGGEGGATKVGGFVIGEYRSELGRRGRRGRRGKRCRRWRLVSGQGQHSGVARRRLVRERVE
jgi:hypothetical protein